MERRMERDTRRRHSRLRKRWLVSSSRSRMHRDHVWRIHLRWRIKPRGKSLNSIKSDLEKVRSGLNTLFLSIMKALRTMFLLRISCIAQTFVKEFDYFRNEFYSHPLPLFHGPKWTPHTLVSHSLLFQHRSEAIFFSFSFS